jgi:hypothetical protein
VSSSSGFSGAAARLGVTLARRRNRSRPIVSRRGGRGEGNSRGGV